MSYSELIDVYFRVGLELQQSSHYIQILEEQLSAAKGRIRKGSYMPMYHERTKLQEQGPVRIDVQSPTTTRTWD